jgi:hypothetical protein
LEGRRTGETIEEKNSYTEVMNNFTKLIGGIDEIGKKWHQDSIVYNSIKNKTHISKTISDLPKIKNPEKAVVINAGPSLHYGKTLETLKKSNFKGPIIAIDGSYVKCLKSGIIPDYVLTMDPHAKRVVRWFGDPNYEKNLDGDDYFSRQDLDIDFREDSIKSNKINIDLVNKYAPRTKLIIASTSHSSVVDRVSNSGFEMYWWMPLVDDPDIHNSLTRKMYEVTRLPALNTGGNVGTSAWVFAQFWLEVQKVAVIGMDLGYYKNLPYEMTQGYYELIKLIGKDNLTDEYFPKMINPLTKEEFYTDPTYFWYRQNILELIKNNSTTLYNCTEGGTLFGDGVLNLYLNEFLTEK